MRCLWTKHKKDIHTFAWFDPPNMAISMNRPWFKGGLSTILKWYLPNPRWGIPLHRSLHLFSKEIAAEIAQSEKASQKKQKLNTPTPINRAEHWTLASFFQVYIGPGLNTGKPVEIVKVKNEFPSQRCMCAPTVNQGFAKPQIIYPW